MAHPLRDEDGCAQLVDQQRRVSMTEVIRGSSGDACADPRRVPDPFPPVVEIQEAAAGRREDERISAALTRP